MLQAALGYIVGQAVAILAIAGWHLLRDWDCPCREELAELESLPPPQPCRRSFPSLHRKDVRGACQCEQEPGVPGAD